MLRIALIGAGRTVTIGHAPALQALRDKYRVVALADQSQDALDDVGILLAVPPGQRYTDYHAMLQEIECDVVSITLPHAYHFDAAMTAIRAGTDVICERPLALSVQEAEEVIRAAEERDKKVLMLHFYLYYPPFREAIRLVNAGDIGEPFFVRCEGVTGGYGPGTATYHPEWHGNPALSGGGVWLDSGYHSAYLCEKLMRYPVDMISARTATFSTGLPVDDTAVAQLIHANGGVSSIQVAWSVPSGGERIFEVYGTAGTIAIDHEGYPLGIYSNELQSWRHPPVLLGRDESFIDLYNAIADCLSEGAPAPVTHQEAIRTLEIVQSAYRASEHHSVERIRPAGTGRENEERYAA